MLLESFCPLPFPSAGDRWFWACQPYRSKHFHIRLPEVLAAHGQLVVNEPGQHVAQLHEEAFARSIAVGKHVERDRFLPAERAQRLPVLLREQRGRRDGDGLTPRREHRPTVAATLRDEKLVARLQAVDYGQVVDAAPRPSRESEAGNISRLAVVEVPVLHPYEVALAVVVGRGEPVDALAVGPGGESAPSRHPRVDASLVEEEAPCRPVEPWVLEEPPVSRGIEGALAFSLRLCRRFPLREDDAVGVGKPLARLRKVEPEVSHHEVDGTHALLHAHEASAGVPPGVVDEAGVMIVVERAEALVPRHAQSYSLGDPLNG